MLKFVASLFLALVLIESAVTQDSTVNDPCKDGTGNDGTCRLLPDCPEVERDAQNGKSPTLCGFHLYTQPIVCCPNNNIETNTIPEIVGNSPSISQQKCTEYAGMITLSYNAAPLVINPSKDSITTVNETTCNYTGVSLIAHGTEAKIGEFPFMALLGYRTSDNEISWRCGGTLLSERYVLTAAHCLTDSVPEVVRLGEHNINKTDEARHKDYIIKNTTLHPSYSSALKLYNDIALIELRDTVEFSTAIRPACLWSKLIHNIEKVTAIGWGQTDAISEQSNVLLKANLKVYDNSICSSRFSNEQQLPHGIIDSMLCAGHMETMMDTCQGDSGGPLLTWLEDPCIYYVVGVTSFGRGCGSSAAVYTRVSKYINWIESQVWK